MINATPKFRNGDICNIYGKSINKIKMKSFILYLILFITSLASLNTLFDDYSISTTIEILKKDGLFDIIASIKRVYGQDLAIISCEELNKNLCGNCKKVVRDYMIDFTEEKRFWGSGINRPQSPYMKTSQNIYDEKIKLEMKNKIMKILNKKLGLEKSELISDNFLKRVSENKIKLNFDF